MEGILVGLVTFFLIGIFHPLVIKGEYYFGKKVNKYFFLAGLIFTLVSIFIKSLIPSIFAGVIACCYFWSIKEVSEQEERVLKGWFPENPNRKKYYDDLRNNLTKDKRTL
ncbi:DUF4491 family protein [uncultured Anaerococcus sp.]|uniref:DUF4491 family protein n=1 Tax=uncultured Anaerococcus sp. TaxID=293428 RepID=UPI0025F65771|nr:DUF4491 family protein [uncultured Anaerococcus sp.]